MCPETHSGIIWPCTCRGLYAWTLSWDAGVSSERRDRSCSRNCLRRFRAPRRLAPFVKTVTQREKRGSESPRSTWWLFTTTSFRLWSPMLLPMYPVTSFRVRLFEMLCWVLYATRPHPNDLRQPTHHNKHTQKSLTCTICQVTILLDPSKTLETKTKRGDGHHVRHVPEERERKKTSSKGFWTKAFPLLRIIPAHSNRRTNI